jgi:hypothetical protein
MIVLKLNVLLHLNAYKLYLVPEFGKLELGSGSLRLDGLIISQIKKF